MAKHRTPRTFDWSHRHWSIRPLWLRSFSRRHRWLVRSVLGLFILPAILILLLARSPLTRILVDSRLERILNLDVDADAVYVRPSGVLVMDRAKFRLPGIPGSAGQFLNVDRIEADVSWWSLLTGNAKAHSITMEQPVLIVSQSVNDGSINIGNLSLPASSGKMAIPPIQVHHAAVEVGENDGDRYYTLRRVQMDGFFRPSAKDGPDGYQFRLQETAPRKKHPGERAEPGFLVNGALSDGRIAVQVEHFTLDDWPAQSVPRPSRERFADLNLRGDVPRASLTYTRDGGLTAQLELHGVGMNLPLELTNLAAGVEGEEGPFPRFVRMSDVSGGITFARDSIQAKVTGLLEDMPYDVKFDYQGLSENSPFTCEFKSEGFKVERNPSLLPYAPAEVRKWLKTFSSPTAVVNTQVTVSRGAPRGEAAGDIAVAGDVFLSNGTAAYEKFPYEFRDMSGHFHFTNDEVRIVEIAGTSPSGATIHADGLIAPLDETAEVTINVQVTGAPIDAALERAFGPNRGQVIRALFSQQRFDELVAAGLVVSRDVAVRDSDEIEALQKKLAGATGDQAAALKSRLAELQRQIAAPVFDFRGAADVAVKVHSPRGKNQPYDTTIDVSIPRAGLVPEKFPLPIVATGVKVRIQNDSGQLVAGEFHALGGGEATVAASFNVPGSDDPEVRPTIDVRVRDLPMGEVLIHALPTGEAAETKGAEHEPVKRMLRDLRLAGTGAGSLHIAPRDGRTDDTIGFDADFQIEGASCAPEPRPNGPVFVKGISGRVRASERDLDVILTGRAESLVDGKPEPCAEGPATAHLTGRFAGKDDPSPSEYHADVACAGLSMSAPIESLVAVFSADAADRIERLRGQYSPMGGADVSAAVIVRSATTVDVTLAPKGDVSAVWMNGRVGLSGETGAVHVEIGDGALLRCENFAAAASFEGSPAGRVLMTGAYQLRPGTAAAPVPEPLVVAWTDAPFESGLVGKVVRQRFGGALADQFDAAWVHGIFDADLTLRAGPGPNGAETPEIRGRLRPRSVALHRNGMEVAFPTASGSIEFEPGSGTVRQLSGQAASWSGAIDGAWQVRPDGVIAARAQITAKAQRLTPDLRAMLPAALGSVIEDLSLKFDGPLALEDGALEIGRADDPAKEWTRFDGGLTFAGASFQAGLPITGMAGRLDASYHQEAGGGRSTFRVDIAADAFKVNGLTLGRSEGLVRSGANPGEIEVTSASGECYGGRYSARGMVDAALPSGGREFSATLQIAGARFHPLLQDLLVGQSNPADPEGHSDETGDFSQGEMDAELTLGGVTNRPEYRRGRGTVRVSGGRVLNIPFMTRMVEVSNLALPTNSRLDYATGDFYIDGGLITFDDLAVHSKSIAIVGYGTMTWPERVLDLRFNSRSERPIPLLSTLIQGLRDELLTTTIKGPLGKQEVRLQQFPGTRRMLGRAVGSGESADARRLTRIETRGRDPGIRPSPAGIQPLPPEQTSVTPTGEEPPPTQN